MLFSILKNKVSAVKRLTPMTDYVSHNWSEYSSRGPNSGSTPLIHIGKTSEKTCFFDYLSDSFNYYTQTPTCLFVNTVGCDCGTLYQWGRQNLTNVCFLNCTIYNHTFQNCPNVKTAIFESN